ncbi:holo-ACP synthase [Solimonas aquatica]|nr:holo-ACP synthase [Solimonas aquatica]
MTKSGRGKTRSARASGERAGVLHRRPGAQPDRAPPHPDPLPHVRGEEGKKAAPKPEKKQASASRRLPLASVESPGIGPGPRPRAFARQGLPLANPESPGSLHGIGVDVLRIERMEQLLQRRGTRVLTRLLCAAERREVKARTNTARALAMCWAAKEAFVKALGCGFSAGIAWRDVGVVREANGRPTLIFSRSMKARLKQEGVGATHISLSDDGGQVCAYVILERRRA